MKKIDILLVEDNEGDILLTTEAFEERKIINNLIVARDGKEAIDILYKNGEYASYGTPSLILMDINLPKKSGHEVLEIIKKDDKLKHIPVIMLTTSSSTKDISLSYQNHVNCYITKPIEIDKFLEAIFSIEDFWLSIVQLPSK